MQGGVPTSVHPQLLAQLSAASGGLMPPQMAVHPGMGLQPGMLQPGMLPEQTTSYSSINSFNSQDSIGSARGSAMSKAFMKAQQQVQSGLLSEAQVICWTPPERFPAEAACMHWSGHTKLP